MLIKSVSGQIQKAQPGSRWKRDAGIKELIEYFDRPAKDSIEKLNSKESAAILDQINKCQDDFIYAARNYFWITNKDTGDQLFRLWESQELILDEILRLKAKGIGQKLLILKARQLGCSTLIEAMIAHATMFFPNTNAVVVSVTGKHAEYLFGIMLHIYDQLPWWLKPMISKRKYEDGLIFDNPNEEARRSNPGLHSRVDVQAATQSSGIGEGRRITAAHVSELGGWPEDVARETVEGDLKEALAMSSARTFAIIESTAKGAGTYYHRLWTSNVELGDRAGWSTMFLPWFFERTRVIAPEIGWRPDKPERDLREKIKAEWTRCDNSACEMFKESRSHGIDYTDTECIFCKKGTLRAYALTDKQMRFIWQERINSEKDKQSIVELRQELCSTAEEAFQLSGYQVFNPDIQDFVDRCVRPPIAQGFIDNRGQFHGVKGIVRDPVSGQEMGSKCWVEHCAEDHRFDPIPLSIWELPENGHDYCIGVDVAEGLGGNADYSVAWINRIGMAPSPDVQVGLYRCNDVDPITFAHPVNVLGRWYNDALLAIEYNKFDTCANTVRYTYQYPHLFRWKHLDNAKDPLANKWHWFTQYNTKPRLWQTSVKWLRANLFIIRSSVCAQEMKTFQKEDYEDRGGSHAYGFHDDTLMACMIALYCSHDMDWSDDSQTVQMRTSVEDLSGDYLMECQRCHHKWVTDNPEQWAHPCRGCPAPGPAGGTDKCGSIRHTATRVGVRNGHSIEAPYDDMGTLPVAEHGIKPYDQL